MTDQIERIENLIAEQINQFLDDKYRQPYGTPAVVWSDITKVETELVPQIGYLNVHAWFPIDGVEFRTDWSILSDSLDEPTLAYWLTEFDTPNPTLRSGLASIPDRPVVKGDHYTIEDQGESCS